MMRSVTIYMSSSTFENELGLDEEPAARKQKNGSRQPRAFGYGLESFEEGLKNKMAIVRIVQLLCPQRHCVIALAYLSEDAAADPLMTEAVKEGFDAAVNQTLLNPWCELCHSTNLHTEDGATRFSNLEEAQPFLKESERAQRTTVQYLRRSRISRSG